MKVQEYFLEVQGYLLRVQEYFLKVQGYFLGVQEFFIKVIEIKLIIYRSKLWIQERNMAMRENVFLYFKNDRISYFHSCTFLKLLDSFWFNSYSCFTVYFLLLGQGYNFIFIAGFALRFFVLFLILLYFFFVIPDFGLHVFILFLILPYSFLGIPDFALQVSLSFSMSLWINPLWFAFILSMPFVLAPTFSLKNVGGV